MLESREYNSLQYKIKVFNEKFVENLNGVYGCKEFSLKKHFLFLILFSIHFYEFSNANVIPFFC